MSSDEAIQLTNNDASSCKSYAVSRGYWPDPYISLFSPLSSLVGGGGNASLGNEHERKAPEMSRGYFARVNAMRTVVNKFLDLSKNCQIVNLGAGYDTLYFNLRDKNNLPRLNYVEVDFQKVARSKIRLIRSKKQLLEKIQLTTTETAELEHKSLFKQPLVNDKSVLIDELHADNYHLVSADLRNLTDLEKKLNSCGLDSDLPTLFLAECVLIYMSEEHSNDLLKFLFARFKQCCFLNYEQCNLNDKFGEVMLSNMEMRACRLMGVNSCLSLKTHVDRFLLSGVEKNLCQVFTMTDFYKTKMDQRERERIERIEFLDESELLFQLLDHYCIGLATNQTQLKLLFF